MDYDKDLTIDPNGLDIEWLKQPRLFMKYAEELANTRLELSRLTERMDVIKAEAGARVRDRLTGEGNKFTVDMVRDGVAQDAEAKSASDAVMQAEHDVNILQAAVKAFDQRKDALENLVRLHGQQYFAGPVVPRDIASEYAKAGGVSREAARDKIAARRHPMQESDEVTALPDSSGEQPPRRGRRS